jgi:YVTN family beta-propeller protein
MKHTRGCLLLRVTCLVCLLGMALVAITAQGQTFAYVANAHSDSVSVIDTASNKVVGTVAVGAYPWGLAITPTEAAFMWPTRIPTPSQ